MIENKIFSVVETNWDYATGFDVKDAKTEKYEGTVIFWNDSFSYEETKDESDDGGVFTFDYDWVGEDGIHIAQPDWLEETIHDFVLYLMEQTFSETEETSEEEEA